MHDISGNQVKLDYGALKQAVGFAVGQGVEGVNKCTAKILDGDSSLVTVETMEWYVRHLAVATKTLRVLEALPTREEIVWVNIPTIGGNP